MRDKCTVSFHYHSFLLPYLKINFPFLKFTLLSFFTTLPLLFSYPITRCTKNFSQVHSMMTSDFTILYIIARHVAPFFYLNNIYPHQHVRFVSLCMYVSTHYSFTMLTVTKQIYFSAIGNLFPDGYQQLVTHCSTRRFVLYNKSPSLSTPFPIPSDTFISLPSVISLPTGLSQAQ